MAVYLLFIFYILGFLGVAALTVPFLQPLGLDDAGLAPSSSLYRVPMLIAALSLPLFLRHFGLASWRAAGYTLPRARAWQSLGMGLLIGMAIMLALTGAQWAAGMHHLDLNDEKRSAFMIVKALLSGLLSGLAVGFIEETIFRGLLHTGMRRSLAFWPTALLTALLYAVLHFVKPAELGERAFTPSTALDMVLDGFARLGEFALFADSFVTLVVVGVFLSMVRERSGNILWAIGIHAGWVMIIKLMKFLTDPTLIDGKPSVWIGAGYDHITGWMATLWLSIIAVIYWYRSSQHS